MDIDCVVIGVNCELTLQRCIQSILDSLYSRGAIHIFYVDGGSTDNSREVAMKFPDVHIVEIRPEYPTPGMGRNAGWRKGASPLVHFFDSDVVVHPHWLDTAVDRLVPDASSTGENVAHHQLQENYGTSPQNHDVPHSPSPLGCKGNIGAVRGNRIELYPERSLFNWIGNLEWNAPPGECDAFGGDVLVFRNILEQTGGYNEVLVAGEDPELSQRIRKCGFKIHQLDAPMCSHDLAMMNVKQYWKRAYRTGYGYAAVTAGTRWYRLRKSASDGFWVYELFRILIRGGGFLFFFFLSLLLAPWSAYALFLMFPGCALLFYPFLFRVPWFMADKRLGRAKAQIYALHCSLVVVPECLGIFRFLWGALLNRPLRNKKSGLKTGLSQNTPGQVGI